MQPIGYPETSVQNYHSTLRNIPEERRSHLHRGGSLKSRRFEDVCSSRRKFKGLPGTNIYQRLQQQRGMSHSRLVPSSWVFRLPIFFLVDLRVFCRSECIHSFIWQCIYRSFLINVVSTCVCNAHNFI